MSSNISPAHDKLAKMLRTEPETLLSLEQKLDSLTGKSGIIKKIVAENDEVVTRVLKELGLPPGVDAAEEVYDLLVDHLKHVDERLYQILGRPNLALLPKNGGQLTKMALELNRPKKGFFVKKERAAEMLEKFPPQNILKFFGYNNVSELIRLHDLASIFSSLRFAQDTQWMHDFFDQAYGDLTAGDFEERAVEIKVLEPQWLEVARKFLEKKYHNVSHLKELGVIFVVPLQIDTEGETLRLFSLLLHYLNEVPFYSKLFGIMAGQENFPDELKSLLRGDVPEGELPASSGGLNIRIVQRYLAKDDPEDFRLKEPHFNPEAEHWYKAEGDLAKMKDGLFTNWQKTDFVGEVFKSKGQEKVVSFDLIDLVMSLVKKGEIKYLYHQEEALWNKIFIEYFGRDKMNELVEENIVEGFIRL